MVKNCIYNISYLNCADDKDLFNIKIHGGGEFSAASGGYVGGKYRYFDNCDVDEMYVLEFGTMLKESFSHLRYCEFSYKLSN